MKRRRRVQGNVLFVQEQGAGAGHITRLEPFAARLKERGFQPIFLVTAPRQARAQAHGHPVLQLPAALVKSYKWPRPLGRAAGELLEPRVSLTSWMNEIYDDENALAEILRLWEDLFSALRPVAVFSDMSFSSMIATHGRIPHVWVGDGYLIAPEAGGDFVTHKPVSKREQRRAYADLLSRINAARAQLGQPPIESLYTLVRACLRLVCTVPELDNPRFRAVRSEPYHRPSTSIAPLKPPSERASARFLAYISSAGSDNPNLAPLLQGLCDSGIPGTLVYPNLRSPTRQELASIGIELSKGFVDFTEAVPKASVLLHFGGLGTTLTGLYAGRPQIVFPTHREQMANGRALQTLGVGRALPILGRRLRARDVSEAVHEMLEPNTQQRAYDFGATLVSRDYPNPVETALEFVLEAMAAS